MSKKGRKRSLIFRALVWLFWRLRYMAGQPRYPVDPGRNAAWPRRLWFWWRARSHEKRWDLWYWKVHLRSFYWARVRRIVFKRDGGMCQGERCWATTRLDVHHRTYIYVGRELEKPEYLRTLITLCRDCHNREHEELRTERTRRKLRAAAKRAA
jgi:5-methylcytosine-specific restriction endonuclease McrA